MYSLMEECRMNAEYEAECKRRHELHSELLNALVAALHFIDSQGSIQGAAIREELRALIAKASGK